MSEKDRKRIAKEEKRSNIKMVVYALRETAGRPVFLIPEEILTGTVTFRQENYRTESF